MAEPTREELIAENVRLRARVEALEREIRRLQEKLEEVLRRSKRQAAPFAKDALKRKPKKPGRKAGKKHGRHGHRTRPPRIDEIYHANLPDACPDCGGGIKHTHTAEQYQVEIPREPIYRQFHVQVGQCTCCSRRVQGRHPLQTSDALGAAESQIGPQAQAAMVLLNKRSGLSHGKIQEVMKDLFGISLSRGGVCQVVLRTGEKLQGTYEHIGQAVRACELVCPDETGWRVGGKSAWLHAAATPEATWYRITVGRGGDILEELLGIDWHGSMAGLPTTASRTPFINNVCFTSKRELRRSLKPRSGPRGSFRSACSI